MPTDEKPGDTPVDTHGGVLRESVREAIRDRVVSGELAPGSRLVERRLAEQLRVSRVPVREALRALEREGFVEERPTGGMVVTQPSDDDLDTLFEVRSALEEILCRRLVRVLDAEGLERLEAVVQRASTALDAGDVATAVEANASFHEALLEQAGSRILTSVIEPVGGLMRWMLNQHDDARAMNAEHAVILDALRDRDADRAIGAFRDHLESSRAETTKVTGITRITGRASEPGEV